MVSWYESLDAIQRIFAIIAIPSTAVLILQTILLLLGIGNGDADSDGDFETGDDGLALFSVRGIVAMLSVGGWSGIALIELNLNTMLVVTLSALIGILTLLGMALLIKVLLKLQSSGNIILSGAIGKTGQVYIPIPAKMNGSGKINITLQDKYSEIAAMTNDDTELKTGELVRVIAADEIGILVVERVVHKKYILQ